MAGIERQVLEGVPFKPEAQQRQDLTPLYYPDITSSEDGESLQQVPLSFSWSNPWVCEVAP